MPHSIAKRILIVMISEYKLIRTRRLSVSLQIKKGGEIVVRAPILYPKYLIDKFVKSKEKWLSKRLAEQKKLAKPRMKFCTEAELKELIKQNISKYADLMGLQPKSLRFTSVRSYWGSCAPTGVISFNLKLIETSPEAVEYVVVHELAHLRWRGHGIRFWELVNKYYPQANEIRRSLRQHPRD